MLIGDIEQVKENADLLAIIGRDTSLKRIATTRGGEYAGPCPFCGGADRLKVQPDRGLWWCRQCSPNDHWQDVIAYVQRRDDVSFTEAMSRLNSGGLSSSFTPARPMHKPTQAIESASEAWQTAAVEVVKQCESALWANTPQARGALDWLHKRGLTNGTLRAWRVGFNLTSRKVSGLWVESGITIPYYAGGILYGINVRRPDAWLRQCSTAARKPDKYRMIYRSRRVLFGVDHLSGKTNVVVVEGELDALLVWQEAHSYVDVLTMGGARQMPQDTWLVYLINGQRFYIATDNDDAGTEAAARWLELVGKKGSRHLPPTGKDVTEYWKNGGNVSEWIASLLDTNSVPARSNETLAPSANRAALPDAVVSQSFDTQSPVKKLSLTLDQIADGELERQGWKIVGADPDLHGSPWAPKIYLARIAG